jgi:hypothetical protein
MSAKPIPIHKMTCNKPLEMKVDNPSVNLSQHRGAQIFQKSMGHLKILGASMVLRIKFQTEDPKILHATIQSLVTTVTWHPGFVRRSHNMLRITTSSRLLWIMHQ